MNKKMLASISLIKKFESKIFDYEVIPNSKYENIVNDYGLPWLKLNIEIPYQKILEEIHNIEDLLVSHRDDYGEHNGWLSFCIHGKSYDATREGKHYNDDRPHIWTPEAQERMPYTVNFFKNVWPHKNYLRLRVMLLEPGGYISMHKDYDKKLLSPINIAITQPNNCKFIMENYGKIPFSQGDAFLIDVSNYHTVYNDSNEKRYHIIIHNDGISDDFKKLVVTSYNKV